MAWCEQNQMRLFGTPLPHQQHYTTPLLDLLHRAIAKFFGPDRVLDAKTEEVVSWLREHGEGVSANVAEAMFTIIKPNDHNPKKKRV